MDPLSLTVGIITILGTGSTIGKGLKKIVSARRQPDILLQLNNEVTDLQYMVQGIHDLLRQQAQIAEDDRGPLSSHASLTSALGHAKKTLLALESLVAYELTIVDSRDERTRLDWITWLRVEPKVKSLKDDIRTDRVRLSSALSLLTSSISLGLHDQMRRLCLKMETVKAPVAQIGDSSRAQHGAKILMLSGSQEAAIPQSNQNNIEESEASKTDTSLGTFMTSSRLGQTQFPRPDDLLTPYAVTFDLTDCSCARHGEGRIRSPRYLNAIFGSLLIGYSAQPWMTPRCDSVDCRGRSTCINYTYAFPRWLLDRMVSFRIAYEQSRGPALCLRLLRVRSSGEDIFMLAKMRTQDEEVAIDQIKLLLTNGRASVIDVDSNGQTALQLAVFYENYKTAGFLIAAGSDVFYEDFQGYSAYIWALRINLTRYKDPTSNQFHNRITALFGHRPNLNLLRFPTLIRSYVCSPRKAFSSVLSMIPRSAVDDVDAAGDTALSWAIRFCDCDSVKQLLLCGSDIERADLDGRTPLSQAVSSGDVAVVQLLLAAKADVNSKDSLGTTALSLAAYYQKHTRIVELLLAHGASTESQDNEGFRPLHYAASYNRPANLKVLLDRSTNINAASESGWTALMVGVIYNAHEALRLLLRDEALKLDGKSSDGYSVLEYAALYGDLETLHLLQSSRQMKTVNFHDQKALFYASWRRDDNHAWSLWALRTQEKDPLVWYSAFEELWYSIFEVQQRDLEGDPEPEGRVMEGELTDDAEDSDPDSESDSHVWEDAQEDLDGSLA